MINYLYSYLDPNLLFFEIINKIEIKPDIKFLGCPLILWGMILINYQIIAGQRVTWEIHWWSMFSGWIG